MIIKFENKYKKEVDQFYENNYFRIDFGFNTLEEKSIDNFYFIRKNIDLQIGRFTYVFVSMQILDSIANRLNRLNRL